MKLMIVLFNGEILTLQAGEDPKAVAELMAAGATRHEAIRGQDADGRWHVVPPGAVVRMWVT